MFHFDSAQTVDAELNNAMRVCQVEMKYGSAEMSDIARSRSLGPATALQFFQSINLSFYLLTQHQHWPLLRATLKWIIAIYCLEFNEIGKYLPWMNG